MFPFRLASNDIVEHRLRYLCSEYSGVAGLNVDVVFPHSSLFYMMSIKSGEFVETRMNWRDWT